MLISRLKSRAPVLAPLGLCAFVAVLAAIPYVLYRRDVGSWEAFTSAFDESTYLLDGPAVPYRAISDLVLAAADAVTPSVTSLMILTDVGLAVIVALAAWALVTRLFESTGARLLAVLLLLFGQELFSLANAIVWPERLNDIRTSSVPTSLELVPDATTSYFSLFRTPEPQVSWAIMFGFLALIAGPDPLRAFEGRRLWGVIAIFAVLPLIYPFIAVPILAIGVALLAYALLAERSRARGVIMALAATVACWLITAIVASRGTGDTTSVIFDSRLPTITPAIVVGIGLALLMVVLHRGEVIRRAELLVALVCSLLPAVIANQQIVTGMMVSGRDWERNSAYILVIFAALVLISVRARTTANIPGWVRAAPWVAAAILAVLIFNWQRDVYRVWTPTNDASRAANDLLEGLPPALAGTPIVVEDAGLVPTVRLLGDDRYDFVLDYTRLSTDPIPSFDDGWETSENRAASQMRIFEYWFRLGRTPAEVEAQLESELAEITVAGFYSHFLFSFRDVWPPLTDWRGLDRDQALAEVPAIVDDYSQFVNEREGEVNEPVVLLTTGKPVDPGDGRTLVPLGAIGEDGAGAYLQRFPAAPKNEG